MRLTAAGQIAWLIAAALAVVSCGRDAQSSSAPARLAPATPQPIVSATPAPRVEDSLPSACPAIACFDGLSIELRDEAVWPAGKYRFTIKYDGRTVTCAGRLPRRRSGESLGIACNRGGAVSDDEGYLEIWLLRVHPAAVDIDIVRDGVRRRRAHYDVEFEPEPSDWPVCPRCRSAAISLRYESE